MSQNNKWLDILANSAEAFSAPKTQKVKKDAEKSLLYKSKRKSFKRFPRRADVEVNFGERWQMDLADLGAGKAFNIQEGEKKPSLFALICIDLFSKKIYGCGLPNKTASTVTHCLKNILESIPPDRVPKVIESDGGGEFNNKLMKKMLENKNVELHIKGGYLKNQVVERAVRSFKKVSVLYIESHWEEFKSAWKSNWIDIVPLIIQLLNKRINRSIEIPPSKVWKHKLEVQNKQIDRLNFVPLKKYFELLDKVIRKKPIRDGGKTFKVGDWVFVQHEKRTFEKETVRNYLYKPWKIVNILVSRRPFMYYLRDEKGRKAKRLYYARELIHTPKTPFTQQIPKKQILDTKIENGEKMALVEKVDLGKPFAEWAPYKKT